jgi:hypothetical protein
MSELSVCAGIKGCGSGTEHADRCGRPFGWPFALLSFADSNGNAIGPTREANLAPGTMTALNFNANPYTKLGRAEFVPQIVSLAVLPLNVTPAAADFADRADAFSQELIAAFWRVRGLSVLGWMKVSAFLSASAVREARAVRIGLAERWVEPTMPSSSTSRQDPHPSRPQ